MKHLFQRVAPMVAGLLVVLLVVGPPSARAESLLLVVEAARDTTAGFRAQVLPELGRRALTWPDGVITLPDTMAWLEHDADGLAFRLDPEQFTGVGAGGRFTGQAGSYKIDTPLYLTDGRVVICLAAGKLDVTADQLIYRHHGRRRDQRGDLLLVGGIILATAVLLRAVRRRTSRA